MVSHPHPSFCFTFFSKALINVLFQNTRPLADVAPPIKFRITLGHCLNPGVTISAVGG